MNVNICLCYGYQAKVDPLLEFLTVSAESRERGKGGGKHVAHSAQNAKTVLRMQKITTECNGISD